MYMKTRMQPAEVNFLVFYTGKDSAWSTLAKEILKKLELLSTQKEDGRVRAIIKM